MRNLFYALAIAVIIPFAFSSTGCSKKSEDASCEKVTAHFMQLAPAQLKKNLNKKQMIDKCEKKLSKDERKCALAAKDFQGVVACQNKKKAS